MAIIKSVLFSGARKKIGNVILQTYNKKTIARSLNTSISVAPSAAQIAQRTKFKNNVGAYNFLKPFLSEIDGLCNKNETKLDAFVRIFNDILPSDEIMTPIQAADSLEGTNRGKGRLCEVDKLILGDAGAEFLFTRFITVKPTHVFARVITFNVVEGLSIINTYELTAQNWQSGRVILPDSPFNLGVYYGYMYSTSNGKCSNLYFQHE